jgi:hypothetical protein
MAGFIASVRATLLALWDWLLHPSEWPGTLWRWARVLWVCRVPATSALAGGLLVAFASQALDLYADLGLLWWQWACFFVLTFGWSWIVHATGRRALQFDDWVCESHIGEGLGGPENPRRRALREQFYWPALVVPRLLGLLVFFFLGWGMCRSRRNLIPAQDGLPEAADAVTLINWLMAVLVALAILYVLAVRKRRAAIAYLSAADPDAPLLIGSVPLLILFFRPVRHREAIRKVLDSRLIQALIAVSVVVTFVFIFAVVSPNLLSDYIPRALFMPVMLGSGVLLLSDIAALSHRWSTPLLLIGTLIGGGLNLCFDHYNDVRWATSARPGSAVGAAQQIGFADAVARWRRVNCPNDSACPRPILIAGAGGASRAGFLTASVVGAMIDAGREHPEMGDVRNRIFALSTVSGSSVGAVMMRAAWLDALQSGNVAQPPCQEDFTNGAWFRSRRAKSAGRSDQPKAGVSWRDCFEQLMAGDFLSPTFVGLAFRDSFPLGNPLSRKAAWYDRTVLLERAFERRYYNVTRKGAATCTDQIQDGLCRRFGYHPDTADSWLPLLFLNGTSVETGRRILVSDVRVGCKDAQGGRFLNLAYDYRELRDPQARDGSVPCPGSYGTRPGAGYDLTLSTAATMSARFPVISTQGVLRDVDDTQVDSIVDGGYFENGGQATLADIARELMEQKLDPLAVTIVNEPFQQPPPERDLGPDRPDLPAPGQRALFDVYTSIAQAIEATRSGHEDGHAAYLREVLGSSGPAINIGVYSPAPGSDSPFCREPIKIRPRMTVVSMSWWMSQPVQAYLDAQLCAPENHRLACALRLKPGQRAADCS